MRNEKKKSLKIDKLMETDGEKLRKQDRAVVCLRGCVLDTNLVGGVAQNKIITSL